MSDYHVGYQRPPVHTRFKKGKSGNPAGRPKRRITAPVIEAALDKVLAGRITVNENGAARPTAKLNALLTQMVHRGLKGHHPTMSMILAHLMKRSSADEP